MEAVIIGVLLSTERPLPLAPAPPPPLAEGASRMFHLA